MTPYACHGTSFLFSLHRHSAFQEKRQGMVQNQGPQTVHGCTELCPENTARILPHRPKSLFVGRVDGQGGEYQSVH
jgi:hypothetical protein